MWQTSELKRDQATSSRSTLPPMITNSTLLTCRPQLQENRRLRLDETLCWLGEDICQLPSAVHSTMRHLSSRHMEVSRWQTAVLQSITIVDREIAAVEEAKLVAERFLQENLQYCQLTSRCLAVRTSLKPTLSGQDAVHSELRKEERLADEIGERLQKQIGVLTDKTRSLTSVRARLRSDLLDKREAVELTARCFTDSFPPIAPHKSNHVGYEAWLSQCHGLRRAAEDRVNDSSAFRGKLRLLLTFLENSKKQQHRRADQALKKQIYKLSRIQNSLMWEKQQVNAEICDLTDDLHRVGGQRRNCDSKLLRVNRRLDILDSRPARERCLDLPYLSLMKEKADLTNVIAELCSVFRRFQRDLQAAQRRLTSLEDRLSENAHALEVEGRCHSLHQGLHTAAVVSFSCGPQLPKAVCIPTSPACLQERAASPESCCIH